jgi:O-antigen ligase
VRLTLRVLQLGAVAVVLAATTYRVFELDRFFVPKELVLHLTALLAALSAVRAFRQSEFSRTDKFLAVFLVLGVISAGFATNGWLAARALGISISGIAVFWAARAVRDAGLDRPLLGALALAAVLGCSTALLQAYGVTSDIFSANRAPGGTLGNRNFIAHMAAFGFPIALAVALRARRFAGYATAAVGAAILVATLVLTRSRAGWLGFAAAMLVLLLAMVASSALRRDARSWLRLGGVILLAGLGVATAVLTPNALRWRSANPYLESIRGVANYQEGSGRGRLVQYQQSLRMAVQQPLLGVGPGNWAVEYPGHAAAGDPSLDRSAPGTTANPWPSSDWVAFIAERGMPAALLLALAFIGMAMRAVRQLLRAYERDEALTAAALLAVLLAAAVAGLFDAVLLVALPSLLVWAALGALWPPDPYRLSGGASAMVLVAVGLLAGAAAVRSGAQLTAIHIFETRDDVATLTTAARIDPGNYRLRLRLARSARGTAARCEHARAAHALFPSAAAARTLSRRCD